MNDLVEFPRVFHNARRTAQATSRDRPTTNSVCVICAHIYTCIYIHVYIYYIYVYIVSVNSRFLQRPQKRSRCMEPPYSQALIQKNRLAAGRFHRVRQGDSQTVMVDGAWS